MEIREAQEDMSNAYYGGGPGSLVSGLVWVISGVIAMFISMQASVLTFFFGGTLIFPISMLISKLLNRSGKHKPDNPLAILALESTILLFVGFFIAFLLLGDRPEWFYSIMCLIIGGRYLLFNTLYGKRIYWFFGALLLLAGCLSFFFDIPIYFMAITGGLIEIVFSIFILIVEKRKK